MNSTGDLELNMHNSFTISEGTVIQRTGISPEILKKNRGPQGGGWEKGPNGRVMWSDAGIEALEKLLAAEAGSPAEPEPVLVQEVVRLTVVRVRTARVLHAVLDGETYDPFQPRHIWLPQPRAILFRKGMGVLGRERKDQPRVYDFEGSPANPEKGRKFPRRPGVW